MQPPHPTSVRDRVHARLDRRTFRWWHVALGAAALAGVIWVLLYFVERDLL